MTLKTLSSTELYLIEKYVNITLTMEQLAEVMHFTYKSLLDMISGDRCPIPTYKIGGKRVANVSDVAEFITSRGKPIKE